MITAALPTLLLVRSWFCLVSAASSSAWHSQLRESQSRTDASQVEFGACPASIDWTVQFDDSAAYISEDISDPSDYLGCCSLCAGDQPKCKAFMSFQGSAATGWPVNTSECILFASVPQLVPKRAMFKVAVSTGPFTPPQPPSTAWPSFSSLAALQASPWASYYRAVYGSLPISFPITPSSFWMIYDIELQNAKVHAPASVGTCPTANPPAGQRYNANDEYQPRLVSWIWHPYPYPQLGANTWQEVVHQSDPFGDEHYGCWFMYTPGSGIYFNTGKTIAFAEHQDAYKHFGVSGGVYNEELSKAAAGQGYQSVQFLAHVDHVNYQCDTQNTGNAGLVYMGFEILATELVGTYSCGTATGAPNAIKAGWMASKSCVCDNKNNFLNCQGVPSLVHALNTALHV